VVARRLCDDDWAAREFTVQSAAFSDRFERLLQRFIGQDLVIHKRGSNGGRDNVRPPVLACLKSSFFDRHSYGQQADFPFRCGGGHRDLTWF